MQCYKTFYGCNYEHFVIILFVPGRPFQQFNVCEKCQCLPFMYSTSVAGFCLYPQTLAARAVSDKHYLITNLSKLVRLF
jgi:hypothetical protein